MPYPEEPSARIAAHLTLPLPLFSVPHMISLFLYWKGRAQRPISLSQSDLNKPDQASWRTSFSTMRRSCILLGIELGLMLSILR
jgi:hypothetical protein